MLDVPRVLRRLIVAGLAIAAGSACDIDRGASAGALSGPVQIGTGGPGGIYHPLGVALAERLSEADTARDYVAVLTGGSIENLRSVAEGRLEVGFSLGTTLYAAFTGGEDFSRRLDRLRIIAPLYPNLTQVLARPDAGIAGIGDLRGHLVAIGPEGGGTSQVALHLFEAYGFGPGEVATRNMSFADAVAALQAGEVDAAVLSVGYPAGAVTAALRSGTLLLPVDSTIVARLAERYPYYSQAEIPVGAYPGLTAPVSTSSVLNWVVGREDLPDAIVVAFLDALYSGGPQLQRAIGIGASINLSNLYAAPIPRHSAADTWLAGSGG